MYAADENLCDKSGLKCKLWKTHESDKIEWMFTNQ